MLSLVTFSLFTYRGMAQPAKAEGTPQGPQPVLAGAAAQPRSQACQGPGTHLINPNDSNK